MSFPETVSARSWRDLPLARVLGSAASWFLFTLNFSLLFFVMTSVMSLGGSCASGGPYEIAVQCPDNVTWAAPLSIFGGLFAVAVGVFLAQGFGTPLVVWAWPILFCGLGLGFLAAFFFAGDITGLILGLMFELMGLVPIVLELRASWQRVFLGTVNSAGMRFLEPGNARASMMVKGSPNPEGAVEPTAAHWAASLGILVVAAFAGWWVARLWFFGA